MTDLEEQPIEQLMPHHGASVLLDHVVAHDGESTTARVIVGSQSWLRQSDGSVASWLAIEYMAQCVATHESLCAHAKGRTLPLGFLVSVTGLTLGVSHFGAGEQLRVRVQRIRGRSGLGALSHACAIFTGNEDRDTAPVAEGRLTIVLDRKAGRDRSATDGGPDEQV